MALPAFSTNRLATSTCTSTGPAFSWKRTWRLGLAMMIYCSPGLTPVVWAQGTAFTYQGRLEDSGAPANGVYEFRTRVFDAGTNGTQQGPTLTNTGITLAQGVFTLPLDFGKVFPGPDRWLEISVRTNGASAFTLLAPRQSLAPSPYAITAGGVTAAGITSSMLANDSVTTDKIAAGAVKPDQIDDRGLAEYSRMQQALASFGGESGIPFSELAVVGSTNGIRPSLGFLLGGSSFGSVEGFTGVEAISQPYYWLVQVFYKGRAVDPAAQVGSSGAVTLTRNGRTARFSGVVTGCTLAGASESGLLYTFKLEPSLALLAHSSDYRIFQEVTVPDLAQQVYDSGTSNRLTLLLSSSYPRHENLVQFGETTLNFFQRFVAYEGIFYLFDHSEPLPSLLLGDGASAYQVSPYASLPYYGDTATPSGETETIRRFQKASRVGTLSSTMATYNFETAGLIARTSSSAPGTGSDYQFGTTVKTASYLTLLANARQQRESVDKVLLTGSSTAADLRAGSTFALDDKSSAGISGTYVVTSIRHGAIRAAVDGLSTVLYGNVFEAIPAAMVFRPALPAPAPLALPCTAVVTGPAGTASYVDAYGRVKVQFHWDRHSARDQYSSAWLRASVPMAGTNRAALFLPRVGDEVLVSFLQGDPNQPFVTGSLFNSRSMPPYALPADQTVTAIRSVGTDGKVNELKFDDKAGAQNVMLQAAKDLKIAANNDIRIEAGGKAMFPGPVWVGGLTVNGGTALANLQAGQVVAGWSSSNSLQVTITFPKAFGTVPKVLALPSSDLGWNVDDTFSATVRRVSTTSCTLNVHRADANGGWSQALRVNWLAWE